MLFHYKLCQGGSLCEHIKKSFCWKHTKAHLWSTCTVRAPVFVRHQFFGTAEHYGKAHGIFLSGWMNYNYTACCWFPTSSNILILPSQFWQIRFESCWLHCSKRRILVRLRYPFGTFCTGPLAGTCCIPMGERSGFAFRCSTRYGSVRFGLHACRPYHEPPWHVSRPVWHRCSSLLGVFKHPSDAVGYGCHVHTAWFKRVLERTLSYCAVSRTSVYSAFISNADFTHREYMYVWGKLYSMQCASTPVVTCIELVHCCLRLTCYHKFSLWSF